MSLLCATWRADARARQFATEQSKAWMTAMLARLQIDSLADLTPVTEYAAVQLEPVAVFDCSALTPEELRAVEDGFMSRHGVVCFTTAAHVEGCAEHPLLTIGRQLEDRLPTRFPITHPAENSPAVLEVADRFDGTVKIFEVAGSTHDALTREALPPHFDGTGNAGTVAAVGMYLDSAATEAPINYFQNVLMLGLALAIRDYKAFEALFLPDAFTLSWQGLKIIRPILYMNYAGAPQACFRVNDSDAKVGVRRGTAALDRAKRFLDEHLVPYAPGSSFAQFERAGAGCLVDNRATIHGRSAFRSRPGSSGRILARKWWTDQSEFQSHRKCSGTALVRGASSVYPDLFGPNAIDG
jgi:hypothetical protein